MLFSLSPLVNQSITIGTQEIPLDGIMRVSANNSRTITNHPIEDGFNISDAIHQLPKEASFSAWITDNPQSVLDTRVFTSIGNLGPQLVEGNVKKQLSRIEQQADTGALITVRTKYALYEDYYLVNFTYEETTAKAILINFSIREKQDNSEEDRTTANFDNDLGLW